MKLLPLLTLLLIFSACRVSLIPDYNKDLIQEIITTAKANDKIYLQLLAADTSERSYKSYKDQYLDVEVEINSITLKSSLGKKDKKIATLIKNVHTLFVEFKEEHKNSPKALKDAEIKDYEMQMNAIWKALLFAEDGLPVNANNQ